MFYKMTYDMDSIDELLKIGKSFMYAEQSNLDEIEYPGIKKGWFNTIMIKQLEISNWPNVEFYYSSKASNVESDYLLNVNVWPIVHKRVKDVLEAESIKGIKFFPVSLIDVVTGHINRNYYFMYIENFIDAFDMERSEYQYIEKYDVYAFIPMRIYLNQKVCQGYDIFRCSKRPAGIYVSERFRNILTAHAFTCFYFAEQE